MFGLIGNELKVSPAKHTGATNPCCSLASAFRNAMCATSGDATVWRVMNHSTDKLAGVATSRYASRRRLIMWKSWPNKQCSPRYRWTLSAAISLRQPRWMCFHAAGAVIQVDFKRVHRCESHDTRVRYLRVWLRDCVCGRETRTTRVYVCI